jgi:hypothetical protein
MRLIFEANEQEKKEILEQHNLIKKILHSKIKKVTINEQTTPLTGKDLLIAAREKKCKIAVGGKIKSAPGKPTVLYKVADYDSANGYFKKGDELYIKDNYTFDVVITDESGKKTLSAQGKKWGCDALNTTTPQLTPQQQKSVNQLVNDGRYTTTEPTADEIGKKEFTKVLITKIPGFDDFPKNYYIWEKTGKRQTQTPQQVNAIKIYTDAGWQDIGGKVNPAEASKYDTVDLKDIYPEDFLDSYKLVKTIESVDTNEVIKELNTLVGTKNFGDRKTCRDIISKYNVAKKKNAPVNDALLRNWKIAVNACKTKVSNFNDLDATQGILRTLTNPPTDKNGAPITLKKDKDGKEIPLPPATEIDKRWDINVTKTQTPKENQPAAGATQPVAPTAVSPTN